MTGFKTGDGSLSDTLSDKTENRPLSDTMPDKTENHPLSDSLPDKTENRPLSYKRKGRSSALLLAGQRTVPCLIGRTEPPPA